MATKKTNTGGGSAGGEVPKSGKSWQTAAVVLALFAIAVGVAQCVSV